MKMKSVYGVGENMYKCVQKYGVCERERGWMVSYKPWYGDIWAKERI